MLRVGIILYPGFQVMNLAVTTVFEFANLTTDEPLYEVALLSEHGGPVATSSGFAVLTQPFDDSRFDTILVVGDNFVEPAPPAVIAFLGAALTARRIGATCTGAFQLAEAGLLDGRRATTHWFHAAALQRTPRLKLDEDRIFIVDGPVWTSAGMTACIDLALALVEHDTSAEIARRVARKLVVYHRRSGGQSQFRAARPGTEVRPHPDRADLCAAASEDGFVGRRPGEGGPSEPAAVQPAAPFARKPARRRRRRSSICASRPRG